MKKPEIDTISWKQLVGNKYNKAIHPAMLSENGYIYQMYILRIGDSKKSLFNVVYDKNYVIEFLSRKICKPLKGMTNEDLISLVQNARELYEQSLINPIVD